MPQLLRFSGALEQDPAIVEWFAAKPSTLAALVRPWFAEWRACGADVRELVHDGCPVVCVEDAPFGYVHVFTAHAAVGFFHGASLPDPAGVLVGAGKSMRHVKLRPGVATDAVALTALIRAAYHDIQGRVAQERLPAAPA